MPRPRALLQNLGLRMALAAMASLALHLAFISSGTLIFGLTMETPEFELEFETIELLDPSLLQAVLEPEQAIAGPVVVGDSAGAPTTGEAPQSETGEASTTGEDATGTDESGDEDTTGPEPEDDAPEVFAEEKSKVDRLGPANSTFFALLANQRIAKLPFAEQAIELIAPLPDFQFIIQGAGFHPWKDFKYIVIASSDIRDWSQTFLAVESYLSVSELQAGLERAAARQNETIKWVERGGRVMGNPKPIDSRVEDRDPRWFVFLDDGVAMYVREEFLPHIISGPKAGKSAGNFVAHISRLEKFTEQHPRAGLQLQFSDMRSALRRAKNFPIEFPNDVELFAEAAQDPELVVKLGFLDAGQAKAAHSWWTGDVRRFIKGDFMRNMMFGAVFDGTQVKRSERTLELRNRFNQAQTKALMQLMSEVANRHFRRTKADIDAARRERDALWKLRKRGKIPPSRARELLEAQKKRVPTPSGDAG